MKQLGFDTVWLQPMMVPHWVRGKKEIGRIVSKRAGTVPVNVCALGGSIGTGSSGISANVVEVKSFDELKALGAKGVQGKIVFFNRPMDPTKINTFGGYGSAVGVCEICAQYVAQQAAQRDLHHSGFAKTG